MDPGNWATAIAGSSAFGYTLLSVVLLANLMAVVLQALSARLGIAAGRDLAQVCRDYYPRPIALLLWVLAELAICATDLAEVLGVAIALNLLFGIPLLPGVIITVLDVFLILFFQSRGFRYIEALVISLIAVIGGCFVVEIALSNPDWAAVAAGFFPTTAIVSNPQMLYVAMGILGATVMPHNLYLHSSIVQTRSFELNDLGRRQAIRYATVDSTVALTFALLINASILIVAAAAFHKSGYSSITEIQDAHAMLGPLLGTAAASVVFAVALLASGLNSTLTGTLAGQIVMEGFLRIRLPAWARRLLTRMVAIVPAIVVIGLYGERGTTQLLILSQVVLSLQLPFAIFPLIRFTSDRTIMGALAAPRWLTITAWLMGLAIIALNIKLVGDVVFS